MRDSAGKYTIPGRPGSQPPPLEEPTEPREPLTPKPDQAAPEPYSPTGQPTGTPLETRAQGGAYLKTLGAVRQAVLEADMVPLVIAPAGGVLGNGRGEVTVQRTFATARSVEFDALLLAGAPGTGADAFGARDAKAGNGTTDPAVADPRVLLMLAEAYRHAKPIAGWDSAQRVLSAVGIPPEAPGVLAGEDAMQVLTATVALLGQHRACDRFPVPVQG